jgi:hypothetical protein
MERTCFGPQVCFRSTSLPVFVTPCWTLKAPPGRLIAAGGRCFLVRPCAHPCATLCDLVLPCARRVVCLGVLGGTSATHVPCALPCALRLFRAPVDLLFQWAACAIPRLLPRLRARKLHTLSRDTSKPLSRDMSKAVSTGTGKEALQNTIIRLLQIVHDT